MRFASRVKALGGARAAAWDSHKLAMTRLAAGEDIIVLSIGEADFATPPAIVETAVEGLRGGRTRYTNAEGVMAFRQSVARYHQGAHRPGGDGGERGYRAGRPVRPLRHPRWHASIRATR